MVTIDNNYVPQGWQCPICKRVYSPTTQMCMYCGEEQKTTITTSSTPASRVVVNGVYWERDKEDGNVD